MTGPLTLRYRLHRGGELVARVAPELGPVARSFYPGFRSSAPERDVPTAKLALERRNGGYLLRGPDGDWTADSPGDAILYYEAALTEALLSGVDRYVHLHAAAVCHGTRALILVGPSGAGKSTLSLGLSRAGLTPLADDAVLIDPEDGEVQPFGRSIRVHEAAAAELGASCMDERDGIFCSPYLWVRPWTTGERAPEARRPAAFVFLERGGLSECTRERLSGANTLRRLLQARLGGMPDRGFEALAHLADMTPGYRLAYADFAGALTRLEALLAAAGAPT